MNRLLLLLLLQLLRAETASLSFIPFDHCESNFNPPTPIPSAQARVYRIGVLAIRGVEAAREGFQLLFSDFLTATAGTRLDPPVSFEMVPVPFGLEREPVDELIHGSYDFVYANPSMYSCIDSEVGLNTFTSVISKRKVNGNVYQLEEFGGVIFTWAGNDEINSVRDLKDKRLALVSIAGLGSGQMQFREMIHAGLHHLQDPSQLIFVENQNNVVKYVLDRKVDVGFVRTDQLERYVIDPETQATLNLTEVKIIGEQSDLFLKAGTKFPFPASTELYPEWALASFPNRVPKAIEQEVQKSLIDISRHATTAASLLECYQDNVCVNATYPDECERECFRQANPWAYQTCDMDRDGVLLADLALAASKSAGFRPPLSYMGIRNMQEEISFIRFDDSVGAYRCNRISDLQSAVVCPAGHFKKNPDALDSGCNETGLDCYGFQCLCKPCVQAYDVDFRAVGDRTDGCGKFEICGSVQQAHTITFQAVDNRQRNASSLSVLIHSDDVILQYSMLPVKGESESHTYEFTLDASNLQVGALIMEVGLVAEDGITFEQIPESPFRILIEPRDCVQDEGDKLLVPNQYGVCECQNSSLKIGSNCVRLGVFIPALIVPVVLLALFFFSFFICKRHREADRLWKIKRSELLFDTPPQVIGSGRFGMVYLGTYRGTKVAVKVVRDGNEDEFGDESETGLSLANEGGGGRRLVALPKMRAASEQFKSIESSDDSVDVEIGNKSCVVLHAVRSRHKRGGSITGKSSSHGSILDSVVGSNSSHAFSSRVGILAGKSWSAQAQFIREMRLLAKLRHPNVVGVMGAVEVTEDDKSLGLYGGSGSLLVMEHMDLGALSDVLRSRTMVIDDAQILSMVQDVAKGLLFLHASAICHGDLKAANILVDSKFRAKISDFGLSKYKKGRTKIATGTPYWMGPELLRGESGNTPATDMFSFGVLMFEAYKRQYPYAGENPQEVLPRIADPIERKRPPIPSNCPLLVGELMQACFEDDPALRPSAEEADTKLSSITQSSSRDQALVWQLFPRHVAAAIREGKSVDPETHESVTVFVSEIVGQEDLEASLSPTKLSSLLDRLYDKFDNLCDLHNVFRLVKTDGSGFMCATNLAEKQDEHVRLMSSFAEDALRAAACTLVDEDDASKGYVSISVGLGVGQVVSHVVGSRTPRYAIFGNAVILAKKLERLGSPGRIHCCETSANLLKEQDPEAELFLNGAAQIDDSNEVITYWIGEPILPGSDPIVAAPENGSSKKAQASLIEWNVDVLARIIREIVASRDDNQHSASSTDFSHLLQASKAGAIIDEVEEVVSFPEFDAEAVERMKKRQASTVLSSDVMSQLRHFVLEIAQLYRDPEDVPFHNFQHASHVTLSVVRLLTRIKAVPTTTNSKACEESAKESLHECSYGIASDPLTQLAIVFSALIHDTDHQGVPNVQLVKEGQDLAKQYKGRSVAEQNSIALAWELFMDPRYNELRHAIARTPGEISRFQQIVINCVMATDIVDKELKQLRNNRWDTAFSGEINETIERAVNRKATIVIEHIIQASDIGHMMQQWHVYRKWNEKFFMECYKAFKEGRAETDPSKGWYKGEIGFFDFYIIPLAVKLQQSGVFGQYGDEYVKNTRANRDEWVACGEDVVAEMMSKVKNLKINRQAKK